MAKPRYFATRLTGVALGKPWPRPVPKTDWQVHAYCLMKTHFHLVVETRRANLVPGMKWLLSTYTIRFNRRHKVFGHLFSGRYQALPVDGMPLRVWT